MQRNCNIDKPEKMGKVWLVGAGTGDVGLITKKGLEVLAEAEVVVFDALISLELLALIPENAEMINAGKRASNHLIPQEEINQILLRKAQEGKKVVRLKGGDPFVFGRGGEELELLAKEQIPFEIVPGITSSIAVPAYNGIPVTHRDYTSSFHVITGHKKKNGVLDINYRALVEMNATLVFLMGVSSLEMICKGLLENGINQACPAAILEKGTTCKQRKVVATVSTLKECAEKAKIKSPAVIVIGKVCELAHDFSWIEEKPLFGKQIMLTRPKNRISTLAQKLRKLGAQVIEMPMICTVPVKDLNDKVLFENWKESIKSIQKEKKICVTFSSPQGVKYFFEQLRKIEMDVRKILSNPNLTFAVLGPGTRKELEGFGIIPEYMPQKYSAGALGELLAKQLDKETKVYLYRAKEASKELTEALERGKISYKEIATYQTEYRKKSPVIDKFTQALEEKQIDYVAFTSASTVKGFVNSFQNVDYENINAVCIGEQTAREASKYKMHCYIAKEATINSLVERIMEL